MERLASAIATIYVLTIFVSPARPVLAAELGTLRIAALATGGVSASDEYLLLEAVGGSVDPTTLEVAYRSASGLTTRRLVDLASIGVSALQAGAKILIANGAGRYASLAAATWSDGIASTGGAVVVRDRSDATRIIDALSWGSAVATAGGEGAPAAAPSNSSILERVRSSGELVDTGNNATDFIVVATPGDPLGAPEPTPSPTPSSSPTPAPTAIPTPTLSPMPTPSPTPAPTPTPAPLPTASPIPTPSPTPSSSPTPAPTVIPTPAPSPTLSPTPTATPSAITCRAARGAMVGENMRVEGVVTAIPGELAEARLAALVDADGVAGLFIYVATNESTLRRGDRVRIAGVMTLRRQALTLVASGPAEVLSAAASTPAPHLATPVAGSWAWEGWEARRVRVVGQLVGAPTTLAGGALSLKLRLASGETLLLAAAAPIAAQIPAALRASGLRVAATGLLHQRGGSAGGGYRLWVDPVAGIVPFAGGGAPTTPGDGSSGSNRGSWTTPRQLPIPLGAPSFGARFVLKSAWLRAVFAALTATTEGLRLAGATRVRLVALPVIGGRAGVAPVPLEVRSGGSVRGSCSATRKGALTVRGGLPILNDGDGSWGLSELPGSTRSACRRPV